MHAQSAKKINSHPRGPRGGRDGAFSRPPDRPQLFYGSGEGRLTRRGAPEGNLGIFFWKCGQGEARWTVFFSRRAGLAGKIIKGVQ